ncbi:hypothetical protein PVK06_000033 [Gossypium arboreum]|uniref:Uncharacterized protein n=1 Tax=Gossypium arboreum TaxID=29729 RepID=A0ABR0QX36_GOSAR|nr:hypothetical protein PVK06_000033 [Gossypium arboreum]
MSSSFTPDETAPFFGFLGRAAALVWRAPYGTAKSGAGVASMGVVRPELLWPVLGIYGLIIAVTSVLGSIQRPNRTIVSLVMPIFHPVSLVASPGFLPEWLSELLVMLVSGMVL